MSTQKTTAPIPVCVTPQQRAQLKALSAKTRISQQAFLREAVADLLAKYKKELSAKETRL